MARQEAGVSLYSRKVLIQSKCEGLLPEWMRFLKGVVDSEDLPLNISRETMQDSALMRKLSSVLAPACVQIHKGSKKTHFAEIREASGVPFDEMVFFDDDPANIRDVAPLGVVCQLTPDGVTAAAWEAALGAYAKARP